MIRAAVRRDGPGEWSFSVADDRGELVAGIAETWPEALRAATLELQHLDDLATVRAVASIRGPITPGDATVPAGGFRCDRRPGWRRWLGLP